MNLVKIHRYGTIGSTNDIAMEMLRRGEPEGTVVTALSQTGGRGRRGRVWQDQPGQNALLSMILTPDKPATEIYQLSFVVSLGVATYLEKQFNLQAALKWPNDVLVSDRKISGILVESVPVAGKQGAVVGIGLNVNQMDFSSDLSRIATSVARETGNQTPIDDTCESLASTVFDEYNVYLQDGFDRILASWRDRMWGLGHLVDIATNDTFLVGHIEGVESSGELLIRDTKGNLNAVHAADTIIPR